MTEENGVNQPIFWWIVGAINAVACGMMGVDKLKAVCHRRRIPERALLTVAACLGAVGCVLGMVLFHHKVSKRPFRTVALVCLAVQLTALAVAAVCGVRLFS